MAAHRLGGAVLSASIAPTATTDGEVWHGLRCLSAFDLGVIALAGDAAVRALRLDDPAVWGRTFADDDRCRSHLPDQGDRERAGRVAAELVWADRGRVAALADALQQHRTLTGHHLAGILGGR